MTEEEIPFGRSTSARVSRSTTRRPLLKDRQRHLDRLIAMHGRINRRWTGFIERWPSLDEEALELGSSASGGGMDALLGYGPCAICGRRANWTDWVSRMPCGRCGRVLCWECVDTGVYGSLPDFQHFVTGRSAWVATGSGGTVARSASARSG